MSETIVVKFDAKDLPAWARRHPEVVQRCKVSLGFRCEVCVAKTAQMKRFLVKEAKRLA